MTKNLCDLAGGKRGKGHRCVVSATLTFQSGYFEENF